jgi:hypothetical protein
MKRIALILIVLVVLFLQPLTVAAHTQADPFVSGLIAGQNTQIGELKVWNEWGWLIIEYTITAPGWCMDDTHLYVGKTLPLRYSPGQFPFTDMLNYYQFKLSDMGWVTGDMLYIAAHTVVFKCDNPYVKETAWARGIPFGKGWAMYFTYIVQ